MVSENRKYCLLTRLSLDPVFYGLLFVTDPSLSHGLLRNDRFAVCMPCRITNQRHYNNEPYQRSRKSY